MKRIVLLAVVVFFLVASFSYHPDTKLTLRYPVLENGTVWDIYGYLDSHELDISDFHYPPAHYWWLKIHYPISKFIGGQGFDDWLASGSAQASFNVNALRYNLAAKFPLLVLGLACGWIIFLIVFRATNDIGKSKRAALFWYFNPITLYSLVMMGQNDVVPILLFLLGMLFYKKWWLMVLLWGVASGVKSYPIIWAIMFMLIWEKNIVKLVAKVSSVVMVYGLILLPWLGKDYFIQAVLNSGLSQRMFVAGLPIGFEKQILVVPLLLVVVALGAFRNVSKNKMLQACFVIFQSCLVILGFSHFNPQWMLWMIPFLSIWLCISGIKKENCLAVLVIFTTWVFLTLGFDDKFLTWGLVTPINPSLINFPSLVEFVRNKGWDISMVINLSQSILAGVSIWYLGMRIKVKSLKKGDIKMSNWLVFVPWLGMVVLGLFLTIIRTNKVSYSQVGDREIYLNETIDKEWYYNIDSNLKYFEISLNNSGLNSQDKGVLVVIDSNGNEFVKEFSGFNAGVNSWLRVDVPLSMSNTNSMILKTKEVVVKDGLLKLKLDSRDRWAVNFYNRSNLSSVELNNKLIAFWWWGLILTGVSILYLKVKEN